MQSIVALMRRPGAKGPISATASMVMPRLDGADASPQPQQDMEALDGRPRRKLDALLDSIVRFAGSSFVFVFVMAILLAWALLGIRFGHTNTWQVVISDAQAIMCYVYDSFLMRQQLMEYERETRIAVKLQSRLISHSRMLGKLEIQRGHAMLTNTRPLRVEDKSLCYPEETMFQNSVSKATAIFGHITVVILFCLAVLIWIGIGPLYGWSDTWQLYMNSASSALMVLIFVFLACTHEQHTAHSETCFSSIAELDCEIERLLRQLTGDAQAHEAVEVPAPRVGRIQRTIFYYADFVGTLTGIAILVIVIVAWVSVGPLLHFSADWWLLIGTYAGLVGMHDAFVLRNLQATLHGYVDVEFAKLDVAEIEVVEKLLGRSLRETSSQPQSLGIRLSMSLDRISSHRYTVLLGFLTLVGLVAGASAMRWSLTGQLLCNVPPSLIESFFMLVLISGHRLAQVQKNVNLHELYDRRQQIKRWIVSNTKREI